MALSCPNLHPIFYNICPANNPFFQNQSHSATCYLLFLLLLMLVLLLTALIPTTARTVAGDSIAGFFDYPNSLLEQPTLAAPSGHVPLVEEVTCLAFPSLKSSEELFLLYRIFCLEIPFYPSYSSV